MLAVALLTGVLGAGIAVGHDPAGSRPAASASSGLLTKGSRGPAVSAVQRKLGGIAVDGIFGPQTRAAVMRFQRGAGLLVDGIVGPRTRAALGLAQGPAPAPEREAAPPQETQSAPPQETQGGAGGGSSTTLERIARCESGGNPGAIGGGGRYRGKYQFTRATWRALGGSGDPAKAPEAEQDRRAALLLERQGASAWPNCG